MERHELERLAELARSDPSVRTFRHLAQCAGVSHPTILTGMKVIGEKQNLEGLFALRKWRDEEAHMTSLIIYLRALALRLGRTPDVDDIETDGVHTWAEFRWWFGSVYGSQEFASLPPNGWGTPSHRDKRARVSDTLPYILLIGSRDGRMRQKQSPAA